MTKQAATKDGLPRKAFAYAPTADPSTWKLPFRTKAGTPDPTNLPSSAASLTEAEVPAKFLPMVKSKLRQAYRQWRGADVEYPDAIRESEFGTIEESEDGGPRVLLREATVLLDRGSVTAQVIGLPNGDTVVIPCWTGAFADLSKPVEDYAPDDGWSAAYDAADAAELQGKLIRMKQREKDDSAQVAMLDAAITAIGSFVKAESDEITATEEAEVPVSIDTYLREAGRRNSSKDSKMIQTIHDMTHDLGAEHDKATRTMHEAEVDPLAPTETVSFRESSAEIVSLAEAGAVFDDAQKQVWITPIQPGFGNRRDNFFYPDTTLREATDAGLFNGLKMFRNHPRRSDEKELPERSVTDWFGVVKESKWDAQNNRPRALVQVFEESDWNRFKAAPEQVAFSVLGQGKVRPGRVNGKEAKVIESFTALRSVDWVTTAGAGGAIEFAESAADEEFEMKIEEMTVEQLTALKESNPTVYEHLVGLGKALASSDGGPAAAAPTDPKAEPVAAAEPVVDDPKEPVAEPVAAPVAEAAAEPTRDELLDELLKERNERKEAEARTAKVAEAQSIVKAVLKETTLPKVATDAIEEKFAESGFGSGFVYADEKGLRAALDREVGSTTKLLSAVKGYAPRATGLGAPSTDGGADATVREAVRDRMAAKWGTDRIPTPDPTRVWTGLTPEDPSTAPGEQPPVAAGISESATPVADRLAAKWGTGR